MITNITIKNFRNIIEENYEVNERNVFVGKNELGKTNRLIAIYWLLTNEIVNPDGCENKKDYRGTDVLPESNTQLVAEVEANINGYHVRRIYREIYSRKRGEASATFDGYRSDLYIDGSPVPARKQEDEIKKILGIDLSFSTAKLNTVALLIDPLYLTNKIDYKDAAKAIFELVGKVSPEEVMATGDYSLIKDIIAKGDIECKRTLYRSKVNKYGDDIATAKGRVDAFNGTFNQQELDDVNAQIEELNKQYYAYKDDVMLTVAKENLETVNDKKTVLLSDLLASTKVDKAKFQNELSELSASEKSYLALVNEYASKGRSKEQEIINLKNKKDKTARNNTFNLETEKQLEDDIYNISNTSFELVYCPKCREILNASEELEFNVKKENKIEELKKKIETFEDAINDGMETISQVAKEIEIKEIEKETIFKYYAKANDSLNEIREKIEKARANILVYESEETTQLKQEIEIIDKEIREKVQAVNAATLENEELKQKFVGDIKLQLENLNTKRDQMITAKNNVESKEKAIANLDNLQKAQATDELILIKLDMYIKKVIEMTNFKVSEWFDGIEFTMLEERVNGEVKEVCYPTYKNIKYTGINSAEKIKIGIKIINAIRNNLKLGDFPILFDGAESIDIDNIKRIDCPQLFTTKVTENNYIEMDVI